MGLDRPVTRGTSNGNASGSSYARRSRKRRMLAPYGGHGGNGETVPCYRCKVALTYETLTVVFARNRMFYTADKVLWDIIDGEGEALLTLQSRATGRRRFNVSRAHLLAVSEPKELAA